MSATCSHAPLKFSGAGRSDSTPTAPWFVTCQFSVSYRSKLLDRCHIVALYERKIFSRKGAKAGRKGAKNTSLCVLTFSLREIFFTASRRRRGCFDRAPVD